MNASPTDSLSFLKKNGGLLAALLFVAVFTAPLHSADPTPPAAETKEQNDARMKWWREARFGMFIHWGIYAIPAGTWKEKEYDRSFGEWIMAGAKISLKDYSELANQFNPVSFNADAWVALAKAAGMKYIIITAKHHDGFAMFKSAHPFNIVDATPYKHDPLKDLAAACAREGIKLGFYYSQCQDWTAPGGYPTPVAEQWDPAHNGNFTEYLHNKAIPQLKELLANYPSAPAVIWFDTPTADMTSALSEEVMALLTDHPEIIINDRLIAGGSGRAKGDYTTPEQEVPPSPLGDRDWETCMTMNGTWGYKSYDVNWKPTSQLLGTLIEVASKGGNFLLNVGPTAEGIIPEPETKGLSEMGNWMKVNGESIYGTSASPFRKPFTWGRATKKGDRIYLFVLTPPAEGKLVLPMSTKIKNAFLLADSGKSLPFTSGATGAEITLPASLPEPIATVVAVDIEGAVELLNSPAIAQAEDGTIDLRARVADFNSAPGKIPQIRLEGSREDPNVGYWRNPEDSLLWNADVKKPGKYEVTFEYAMPDMPAEVRYVLNVGDQTLRGALGSTGKWTNYEKRKMGTISIAKAGVTSVTIQPDGTDFGNLTAVTLTPIP